MICQRVVEAAAHADLIDSELLELLLEYIESHDLEDDVVDYIGCNMKDESDDD